MTTEERWAVEELRLGTVEETFLKDRWDDIKELILKVDPELETLRGRIEEARDDYRALEADNKELEEKNADLEKEIDILKDEVRALEGKLDALS